MTKQQKIEYINKVNDKFINASNHGNGSNWWYPKQNTIAYNVKLSGGASIEDIKKEMTKRQKEYYNKDEQFYDIYSNEIEQSAEMLVDEVEEIVGVKTTGFAGRSGGWFEVEYSNDLDSVVYDINNINIEELDKKDIDEAYTTAKDLESLEAKVETLVSQRHSSLEKYLGSKEYAKTVAKEVMLSDKDIAEIYKGRAKDLLDKLN